MTPAEWHAYALRSLDAATKRMGEGPQLSFVHVSEACLAHWEAHKTGLRAFRWRAHQRLNSAH